MAGSGRRSDAVASAVRQLVQYEDDDDHADKVTSHSDHMSSASATFRGVRGQYTSGSFSHLGNQGGMEKAEDVAVGDRVGGGNSRYQENIDDGAREHVSMETHLREDIVAHHQPHIGAEGSDLASEAMRVFCSYDGGSAEHGHTEDTRGGVGNDYSEEDLQERGSEEAALEERVHGDQSPGYVPEDAERGEHSSFSSLQQLQLRAQILVYGDLIKGVLPDESLMSSAFSDENEGTVQESDRSTSGWNWEGVWQLAVEKEAERREAERLAEEDRINKGDVVMTEGEVVNAGADNLEPGTPSTSPIRVAEDPTREVLSAAMPQVGGPADLSVASLDEHIGEVSGVPSGLGVNLDAVVDNIVAAAGYSVDSSLLKDGNVEKQVTRSPSLDPWLKPHSSPVPLAPGSLGWQTPGQAANAGEAATANTPSITGGIIPEVPSTFPGNAEVPEEDSRKRKGRERKTTASKVTKAPRRSRAKNVSADTSATPATAPAAAVASHLVYESSEVAVIVRGGSPSNRSTGKKRDVRGRSNLYADTQNWLEEAKASFEEAVSAANSAAEQVQRGNSVTTTPKLASAAAAVHAAAAVAKAAAEAAKVAYEAALQAAMMVSDGIDSGLGKVGIGNGQGDKDGGLGGRRSAIAAAKEEARKRATSATRSMKTTPQTTDAVLRAARVMAEAASEAGAALAKGNSGVALTSSLSPVSKLDLNKMDSRRSKPKKEDATVKSPEAIKTTETGPLKNLKSSMKKGARKRGKELQELNAGNTPLQKNNDLLVKSAEKSTPKQLDQVMSSPSTEGPEIIEQKHIVEGSLVEVMNDEEGLRGGWFSAKVLQLRPGEAFVQYDEILTDDGTTQLKEWFPLEGPLEGTEPGRPRIRLISPNNIAREEGRRKRRRTATGQKVVAVGDRVDAFVQDGWWEGIVKVIDEDDESKITVHFPGEGDTSTVKSWNLRPSFMWKDGRWEQSTRGNSGHETLNDGQQSKKQKVVESPKVQARKSGRGKLTPGKVSDESTENARASRRPKTIDSQSGTAGSPAITTRSSPRQKIPPKRKEGPTEVSTPTQAPTPVNTRTRSVAQDAVIPVKEPLKRSAPSRTKSPRTSDVKTSESPSTELVSSRKSLRNSEATPSEDQTPATRQEAKDIAKPATRRSARL